MTRKQTKRTPKATTAPLLTGCTATYVRVSTQLQADEGYSLAAQTTRLQAYCVAQGWQPCADYAFVDAGESGSKAERPAYRRLLAAITERQIDRVVVVKLDRLSRNTRDFLELLDLADSNDVGIVSITENFDTGTPTGRAVVTVLLAFAELERKQIAVRVDGGKRQAASEGKFVGSRIPLGYSYQSGSFTPNASAATVKRIFSAFLAGDGMKDIATRLDGDQVPTAMGGKWAGTTVRTILQNGAYAGLGQWDGIETATSAYPAIIERAEYEAAQARIAGLKPGRQPQRS